MWSDAKLSQQCAVVIQCWIVFMNLAIKQKRINYINVKLEYIRVDEGVKQNCYATFRDVLSEDNVREVRYQSVIIQQSDLHYHNEMQLN